MKTYSRAPHEVNNRVIKLVDRYHSELKKNAVTFDLLFRSRRRAGTNSSRLPVLCRRAIGALEGACEGRRRCEGISIDANRYVRLPNETKDALLDHELYHLQGVEKGWRSGRAIQRFAPPRSSRCESTIGNSAGLMKWCAGTGNSRSKACRPERPDGIGFGQPLYRLDLYRRVCVAELQQSDRFVERPTHLPVRLEGQTIPQHRQVLRLGRVSQLRRGR